MTKRLTTRSIATAEAIRDAEPFITSGSLKGSERNPAHTWIGSGELNAVEAEMLRDDATNPGIDYVVWSYSTPIAWRRVDGKWRIVAQSFSITTSKHQGNLYLIDRGSAHETEVRGDRGNWAVVCTTGCGKAPVQFTRKPEAYRFAHGHRFNHDHPVYSI